MSKIDIIRINTKIDQLKIENIKLKKLKKNKNL